MDGTSTSNTFVSQRKKKEKEGKNEKKKQKKQKQKKQFYHMHQQWGSAIHFFFPFSFFIMEFFKDRVKSSKDKFVAQI